MGQKRPRRSSEREPADSLRDKSDVIGGWLPSLTLVVDRTEAPIPMKDLTDYRWIKLKGVLFLIVGLLSSMLLLLDHPEIKTALLLAVAVWCFCRFYYFAFYVIERYVDPSYRFSGLCSLARYLIVHRHDRRSV